MVRITGLFYLPIVSKITFKLTQMNLEPDSLGWQRSELVLRKVYTPLYIGRIRKANHISAVFLEKERLRRTEVERLLRESKEETRQ